MDAMDPRIQEIMAKLNKQENANDSAKQKEEKTKAIAVVKPPTTFDQFLSSERMKEWPQRLTSENVLDLSEERERLGNITKIEDELKEATPIDLHVLRSLEKRLDKFDETLLKYANMVLNLEKDEEMEEGQDTKTVSTEKDNLPLSVNRDAEDEEVETVDPAFLTEMAESDAVKAHPSRKQKQFLETKGSYAETRKKTVEHCKFPGFHVGELTELPAQLEAPHILHRITKAQDFNKTRKEQQSKLFDRIADSFVALFTSVNPEIKDKVFLVYADCLAQCIYAAFYEAFPESIRLFQDEFKQYLVEVTTTWISGVKPTPGAAKHWNAKRMLPRALRNMEDTVTKARREMTVNGPKCQQGQVNGPTNTDVRMPTRTAVQKLDMDDFMKQVDHLGTVQSDKPHVSKVVIAAIQAYQGHGNMMSREATKMTNQTMGSKYSQAVSTFPTVTASRVPQIGSPREKRESHVIGPGAELERVRFNLKGRSPLVAHYLHMHQLKDNKPHGGKIIHRTEITKLPDANLPTYRELITETLQVQDTLSKEYQKVCEDTNQEILKIERQQRDTNRKIEKLQKQLLTCKNSMEVKIMSEKILEKQDVDSQKLVIKDSLDEDDF